MPSADSGHRSQQGGHQDQGDRSDRPSAASVALVRQFVDRDLDRRLVQALGEFSVDRFEFSQPGFQLANARFGGLGIRIRHGHSVNLASAGGLPAGIALGARTEQQR